MLSLVSIRDRITSGELDARSAVAESHRLCVSRSGELKAFAHLPEPAGFRDTGGPLAGIAVGIKDVIDTADMPTELGCPAVYGGWRPRADAAIVSRIRQLGGTILGKTVTTPFAFLDPAETVNPHRADRTPGGSSSGSAAAVAAGLLPLAVGTQTGGSVIRPASYCGVAGMKPSFRLLPTVGVKTTAWTLDTLGLFAATVADLAYALEAISGRSMTLPDGAGMPRFGVTSMPHAGERSAESDAALDFAARALERAGAAVVPVTLPEALAEADRLQPRIYEFELHGSLGWEWRERRADLPPRLCEALAAGEALTPESYDVARGAARRARQAAKELFAEAGIDVLLTLSAPGPAPGRETTGEARFNRLFTLLGVPCVNVPGLRSSDGMPIGIQVAAPFARDARALQAAAVLERALAIHL